MKNLFLLTLLLLCNANFHLMAQNSIAVQKIEEVVITATKYETPSKNVGKIIYKISEEDLKQNPQKSVVQLLDEIPGFEINGSDSNVGKNLGTYVRGGSSEQTLVVIDGIPVTDPSAITLFYDLNLLNTHQIESIEIMKGAASSLYGTGAATAVINIKTKKAAKKELAIQLGGGFTTNRTSEDDWLKGNNFTQNIGLSGSVDQWSYHISYAGKQVKGMSEAVSDMDTDFEEDPFKNTSFMAKMGYHPTKKLNIHLLGNYTKTTHDFDVGPFLDSDQNILKNTELRVGLTSDVSHKKGVLHILLNYKNGKRNYDYYDFFTSTLNKDVYNTKSLVSDVYNIFRLYKNWRLITGFNFQRHIADSKTTYGDITGDVGRFSTFDPYLNFNISDFYGFNFNAGVRLNWHNMYGTKNIFSLNPSYSLPINDNGHFKLMTSYSTAYIVPSIYQLYSNFGNKELLPETSRTFEVGWEFKKANKLTINGLYFTRRETDRIIFVYDPVTFDSNYANEKEGELEVNGIEASLRFTPITSLELGANYTFTEASKERPHGIPRYKWNFKTRYTFLASKTSFQLDYRYTSERTQGIYTGTGIATETLAAYHLFDISGTRQLWKDRLRISVALSNIFDTTFVETVGYSTLGRNFSLGFQFSY